MSLVAVIVVVVVVLLALGGRWLLRERTPDEIRAARERLRKIRRR
jgi:putative copper export protein